MLTTSATATMKPKASAIASPMWLRWRWPTTLMIPRKFNSQYIETPAPGKRLVALLADDHLSRLETFDDLDPIRPFDPELDVDAPLAPFILDHDKAPALEGPHRLRR